MNDLISRSALLEILNVGLRALESKRDLRDDFFDRCLYGLSISDVQANIELVKAAPAVDAVEVVRCGECEKRETTECALSYFVFDDFDVEIRFLDVPDDFYCPYGERRTDNES